MNTHEILMRHSLGLARQGEFHARPNPLVGSVVVAGGEVIGQGSHERFGQAHAEINALRQAGARACGATLYVTLEPCCFTGKTGPCADAVIAAGISEVVYGMEDPNPAVSGLGLQRLREAGIRVTGPVLEQECRELNRGFISRMTRGRPWVRNKMAMSLDGRTAMASGESQWITGPEAREDVHKWRARSDVVITGIGTVLKDQPSLNVRLPLPDLRQPLRVVVDSRLLTPVDCSLFRAPGPVLIATAAPQRNIDRFMQKVAGDVRIVSLPDRDGRIQLADLLSLLSREENCGDVLLECGAELAGAFLRLGLIDELITYVAPTLMGSDARPLYDLPGISHMADRIQLEPLDVLVLGKDCRMRSLVHPGPDSTRT